VVLLTVPLVGCVDDGQTPATGSEDGMRAADGLDQARAIAEDWNSEAELVGASTRETTADSAEDWPEDGPDWQADDEVGDGYAPQWVYTFEAGDDLLSVFVTDDGQTHEQERDEQTFIMQDPIEDWSITSADAVEAAREEHDGFASTLEEEGAEVDHLLAKGNDQKAWALIAHGEDGQVEVTVDAETGDVQET
jgi:hypothetical protein